MNGSYSIPHIIVVVIGYVEKFHTSFSQFAHGGDDVVCGYGNML
jgi:hypothetical protein